MMKQAATRSLKDFFGINQVTSKDIAGAFSSITKLSSEEITTRYRSLLRSRNLLANKVFEHDAVFGVIRRDIDNQPRKHGQFDPDNEKKLYDTIEVKQQFVPEPNEETTIEAKDVDDSEINNQDEVVEHSDYRPPYRISDVEPVISLDEVLDLFRKEDRSEDLERYLNKPPLTFYFDLPPHRKVLDKQDISPKITTEAAPNQESYEIKLSGRKLDESEIRDSILEAELQVDKRPPLEYDPEKDIPPIQDLDPNSEEYYKQAASSKIETFDQALDDKYDDNEVPKAMSALDYLKKIRSQRLEPTAKGLKHRLKETDNPYNFIPTIKLDSKGYHIYTDQVPDWSKCRRADVLAYLKRAIIYNNYDIIAINKPYGLASHEGNRQKERFDINSLMQVIGSEMRLKEVFLAHRLDKTTSGILLFATTQEQANRLNKLFKSDQIKKTYWCVTRGVPSPEAGLIDIPIGEFEVANKMRSCLVPVDAHPEKQLAKRYKEARRAVSEYNVIAKQKDVALLEVKPRTGVKHQIRCHLSFALGTPILGDHKYSNIGKIAPQKLPTSLLKSFHIRQEKVRTIPIHLHAKSIVIPGIKANGETLHINSPLPRYFIDNLKRVKLLNDYVNSRIN